VNVDVSHSFRGRNSIIIINLDVELKGSLESEREGEDSRIENNGLT